MEILFLDNQGLLNFSTLSFTDYGVLGILATAFLYGVRSYVIITQKEKKYLMDRIEIKEKEFKESLEVIISSHKEIIDKYNTSFIENTIAIKELTMVLKNQTDTL